MICTLQNSKQKLEMIYILQITLQNTPRWQKLSTLRNFYYAVYNISCNIWYILRWIMADITNSNN